MNLSDEQRDAMLIDRLVDGELSGDERRHLLASLEAQPDGWRRCALAFVEAQTWRGAMGSLLREGAAPARARLVAIVAEPSGSAGASPSQSRIIAFALGDLVRRGGFGRRGVWARSSKRRDAFGERTGEPADRFGAGGSERQNRLAAIGARNSRRCGDARRERSRRRAAAD